MKTNILIAAILLLSGIELYHVRAVHAQTAGAVTFQGGGPHTTCATPVPGISQTCIASDGLYQSDNGGAYWRVIQLTTSAVTSVNGKTGAVVLGATTVATTTMQ
jgi:hypothetical protein